MRSLEDQPHEVLSIIINDNLTKAAEALNVQLPNQEALANSAFETLIALEKSNADDTYREAANAIAGYQERPMIETIHRVTESGIVALAELALNPGDMGLILHNNPASLSPNSHPRYPAMGLLLINVKGDSKNTVIGRVASIAYFEFGKATLAGPNTDLVGPVGEVFTGTFDATRPMAIKSSFSTPPSM